MTWTAGQKAVIDRREIVTIDRVTPSGMAVVGNRRFVPEGWEYGRRKFGRLEAMSGDVEAVMDHRDRMGAYYQKCSAATHSANMWISSTFQYFAAKPPTEADYAKAERIAAAIEAAMEDPAND